MPQKPDAVLVLTFGGPEGPNEVMPFLRNVTAGRNVPDERLRVVARQYAQFGGRSPLNDLSRALVESLKTELGDYGHQLPVYWGTRNWAPFVGDTVETMARDGVQHALVFADSAYSSYSGCRQYEENLQAAAERATKAGLAAPTFTKLRAFYNHPAFIDVAAQATMQAIGQHAPLASGPVSPESVRLVFTAHSIPVAMSEECAYERQLGEAAALVVERLGPNRPTDYDVVFQSRSGPPQVPWLEPDICAHLSQLDPAQPVTIVPIGFTQDHTEILYDLDTLAAAAAEERGLSLTRAKTPGSHHHYIKMIRELIEEEVSGGRRLALGSFGPEPAHSGPDHCRIGARR